MPTIYNNNLIGNVLDDIKLRIVWCKANPYPFKDPNEHRIDDYGNEIRYSEYGNRNSTYGWEIDHIIPKSQGGSDDISNLRPLHYKINAGLGALLAQYLK